MDYPEACLRHDLTWRTLPVIDDGTGRVWNERNRWVADEKFRDDSLGACAYWYPNWQGGDLFNRASCEASARLAHDGIRDAYDDELTDAEDTSVDLREEFIQYPPTGSVDCSPSTGRCLPLQFMTLDGRAFAPQNIPYIKTGRVVKLRVVRAHQLYPEGPPTTSGLNWWNRWGEWLRSGEITLRTEYPIRASKTEAVSCLSTADQDLPIDFEEYSSSRNAADEAWRETVVYITSCHNTRSSEEDDALIEFLPLEARYRYQTANPYHRDGDRVRHYENIRADSCHATDVDYPVEVRGSLLGTDCLSTRTHGGYADFYTFYVSESGSFEIELMSDEGEEVDTYLYLLRGSRITGAEEDHDDDGGSGRNSELSLDLTRGDYTVVATNYGRGRIRTGDYMLKIRNEQSCPVQAISGRTTRGQWTHSDCESTRREESYVDYYTFEVTGSQSTRYRIDVDSSVDSYMYLIEGDSPARTDYLERDDDGGPGRDARITRTMAPGTYTIAVTTYDEYETGSYTLRVREY